MKTKIFFIRHGETNWNNLHRVQGRTDIPLNENGIYQAHMGSYKLNSTLFDVIYSSPLLRAYETAQIFSILTNQTAKIVLNELLIERSFGALEGQNVDINGFTSDDSYYLKNYIGFESNKKLEDRALNFIEHINKFHQGKNIACFSHSHFIKAVASSLKSNYGYSSKIDNCGIIVATINSEKVKIDEFNI